MSPSRNNTRPLRRLARPLLILVVTALCMAQSAVDLESDQLNRVARRLQCNCGCNMDMTCRMEPYMCGTCKMYKTRIYALQQAGKSDNDVISQIVSEEKKKMSSHIAELRQAG